MSWGTQREGTKAELEKSLAEDFERFAASYPPGTLEGDDIIVARKWIFHILAALDVSEQDAIKVVANGSHSWSGDKEHPLAARFTVDVAKFSKP